jgi:hypothetical protein
MDSVDFKARTKAAEHNCRVRKRLSESGRKGGVDVMHLSWSLGHLFQSHADNAARYQTVYFFGYVVIAAIKKITHQKSSPYARAFLLCPRFRRRTFCFRRVCAFAGTDVQGSVADCRLVRHECATRRHRLLVNH